VQNIPLQKMEAILDLGSGKTSAPSSSRARVDDTSSDDDDCIILEVYDPMPISYAYPADPALADPETQVVENVVPLAVERMTVAKISRTKGANTQDSGPSDALVPKRRRLHAKAQLEAKRDQGPS
jgi:hypothetical protein